MLIKDFEPYARIYWLEDVKSVRVEYLNLFAPVETWEEIWNVVLEVIYERKTQIWIHDSYTSVGVFTGEVQDYVKETLIPQGMQAGIRYVLTVIPKEQGLVTLANKRWQTEVNKTGVLTTVDFLTMEDAKEWALNHLESKK